MIINSRITGNATFSDRRTFSLSKKFSRESKRQVSLLANNSALNSVFSREESVRDVKRHFAPNGHASRQTAPASNDASSDRRNLRVIIAGAGIGGLVLAVSLLRKGFDVKVLERDLTAIRGEGKYRGPIQIQSNALGALEAIDPEVAERVMAEGCITGDRINGLCDGVTGDWYVKFDTFHPAADNGLPVTRVISRVTLQQILAQACVKYGGPDVILGNSHVTSFTESSQGVSVTLEDGRVFQGDVLVGADGIWSKIRKQLVGESLPSYSQYTCYTGISDFTPADIDVVGYRVFLGNAQYFVSSDVGGGKMQWYGFHKEAAGGTDQEGTRKKRLLEIFGHWSDNVVDLIKATPEEDILRRDIFDRPPIFKWFQGRTVLLGDSVHAMQPNLGQGGCMAIEDAYSLGNILDEAFYSHARGDASKLNTSTAFLRYQGERMLRASTIHGMAGMAAFMASTYKAYLGEGLPEPLASLAKLKIPHPGRVAGQAVMKLTMPGVLGWVLGGNVGSVEGGGRTPQCRIHDQPKAFSESHFPLFMADDEAIVRAAHADWMLVAQRAPGSSSTSSSSSRVDLNADVTSTSEIKGVYIGDRPLIVGGGRGTVAADLVVSEGGARSSVVFAKIWRELATSSSSSSSHDYFIQNISDQGTWVDGKKLVKGESVKLRPGQSVVFGHKSSTEIYKVKLQHISLRNNNDLRGNEWSTILISQKQNGVSNVTIGDRNCMAAV